MRKTSVILTAGYSFLPEKEMLLQYICQHNYMDLNYKK